VSETLTGRPRVSGLAPRGIVAPGDRVRWTGEQYTVSALSGTTVHLAPAPGSAAPSIAAAIQFLAVAEDFAVLDETGLPLAANPFPNWAMLEGVSPDCARDARTWRPVCCPTSPRAADRARATTPTGSRWSSATSARRPS
jgi:hypothetical protein